MEAQFPLRGRHDSKPLDLVASVKTMTGEIGYVKTVGLARVQRQLGGASVYFPVKILKGFTFIELRIFKANFLKIEEIFTEENHGH